MLSTLVLVPPADPGARAPSGALVRTLTSLVPGTIGGLVRDVMLVTTAATDDIRQVAEHAGCAVVERPSPEAALRAALDQARSPLVFLLRAGAHVDGAVLDEVAQAYGPASEAPPALVLREAPDGLVRRVLPDLARAAGLIAPASVVDASAKDFDTLVRRVAGRRTLNARAVMAS